MIIYAYFADLCTITKFTLSSSVWNFRNQIGDVLLSKRHPGRQRRRTAVSASYFRPYSPFRTRFSAAEALARERKARLAKRYRKSMGTRSRMYHRYLIYNILPVLTSNSTPPQYDYFLFDKKVKIIMPEFLKTELAKIRTHSTTWQLKTIKFVQKPVSYAWQ